MDSRDEDVFCAFVAARSRSLLRSAYVLTRDHGKAEDLVQTALVRAYVSWHRIRNPQDAEAYVRSTMNRLAISWWRRRWHGERPSATLPDRPVRDDLERVAERDVLDRAFDELTPRQRAVLVLRFYDDRSCEETAELLGCSVGSVKQHSSRALASLRRVLPGDDATEVR